MKLTCVFVRNVSYMGMNLLRTVGLIQFSLPEQHPNNVKWAVKNGSNKSTILLGLTFITSEGPLEHILILVRMYVFCRPAEVLTRKLCDDLCGKESLSQC